MVRNSLGCDSQLYWKSMKEACDKLDFVNNWEDGFKNINTSEKTGSQECAALVKCPDSIWKTESMCKLSRDGDVLVGWYLSPESQQAKTIEVWVGGNKRSHSVIVQPGSFEYCLQGTHPLVMLNIQYSEVNFLVDGLPSHEHIIPIFASLHSDSRRSFGADTLFYKFDDHFMVSRGNFFEINDLTELVRNTPHWRSLTYHVVPSLKESVNAETT